MVERTVHHTRAALRRCCGRQAEAGVQGEHQCCRRWLGIHHRPEILVHHLPRLVRRVVADSPADVGGVRRCGAEQLGRLCHADCRTDVAGADLHLLRQVDRHRRHRHGGCHWHRTFVGRDSRCGEPGDERASRQSGSPRFHSPHAARPPVPHRGGGCHRCRRSRSLVPIFRRDAAQLAVYGSGSRARRGHLVPLLHCRCQRHSYRRHKPGVGHDAHDAHPCIGGACCYWPQWHNGYARRTHNGLRGLHRTVDGGMLHHRP